MRQRLYAKLYAEKFFVGKVMRGLLLNMPLRMGVHMCAALQTTVMGWADSRPIRIRRCGSIVAKN